MWRDRYKSPDVGVNRCGTQAAEKTGGMGTGQGREAVGGEAVGGEGERAGPLWGGGSRAGP